MFIDRQTGLQRMVRQNMDSRTRIAVVGSSGNLLYRGRGAEIDEHDIVIRTNGPVLKGYEHDVGYRTDIRVAWSTGFADAVGRKVLGADETTVFTCVSWSACHTPSTRGEVFKLSMNWLGSQIFNNALGGAGSWPSTGFHALVMPVTELDRAATGPFPLSYHPDTIPTAVLHRLHE